MFGGNGSGKSSFQDAVLAVRQWAVTGLKADQIFRQPLKTRRLDRQIQTFEIEADLDVRRFCYRIALDLGTGHTKTRVVAELVHCEGRP